MPELTEEQRELLRKNPRLLSLLLRAAMMLTGSYSGDRPGQ